MKFSSAKIWISALLLMLLAVSGVAAQSAPVQVPVNAQTFENGLMIYRADTGEIWVFVNDGRALNFTSEMYANLPDNPIFGSPPSRLRPIMGFGKLWGHNPTVRAALGWPTQEETSFQMGVALRGGYRYFTKFDGSIMEIHPDQTWRYTTVGSGAMPPNVRAFDVWPSAVTTDNTVHINWDVQGVDLALIEMYLGDEQQPYTLLQDLAVTGSTTLAVPAGYTHAYFVLQGANYPDFPSPVTLYERVVKATVRVDLQPEPSTIETTYAAYQPFERGFLVWQAQTGEVLAFSGVNDGNFWTYPEYHYASMPDNTLPVPTGHSLVNAFGKLWGNETAVRDALGYPTAAEQGYQMTVEYFVDTALTHRYSLPDGRVISVWNSGVWRSW